MTRLSMREAFDLVYHIPRSQVWEGSRGRQTGNVHLHVKHGEAFQAGRIRRTQGQSLCGRSAWYPRPAETTDTGACERCAEIGGRESGVLTALVTCHTCGSTRVFFDPGDGACCAACGRSDSDE